MLKRRLTCLAHQRNWTQRWKCAACHGSSTSQLSNEYSSDLGSEKLALCEEIVTRGFGNVRLRGWIDASKEEEFFQRLA